MINTIFGVDVQELGNLALRSAAPSLMRAYDEVRNTENERVVLDRTTRKAFADAKRVYGGMIA